MKLPVSAMTILALCLAAAAASAQAPALDYERDCVDGFNKLLQGGHNFRARFDTARTCVDVAKPRLYIGSTKEYRSALRDNIRTYYRVMVSSALTMQADGWKLDADLSLDAFRTFSSYITSEYPEITPENIDHYFEDSESFVALGLFGGDYGAAAEAGKRAIETFARFRGSPWFPGAEAGVTGKAPDEIAGIAVLTALAALMSADLGTFTALGPDAPRAAMLRDECRSLFAVADNPGARRSLPGLFLGEKRNAFMGAVLKIVRQLRTVEKDADRAAVSCGSNLAGFFARIGDMDTALKIYGEIAAFSMPTFDLDPEMKKSVLPKLIGVIENPMVKGEAICALGDMNTADGDLAGAANMFGTAFKLLKGNGLAARTTCWIRSACALGKSMIKAGKADHAYVILNGAQEAARAENVFPGEKCALGGSIAAAVTAGKAAAYRPALDEFLNAGPGEADFAAMLGAFAKPEKQKVIYDEVAKRKPDLVPAYVRGLLLSADPPDKAGLAIASRHLALLNEEGKALYRLKAAKAAVKAKRNKEAAADLAKYLREIPQRRFKEEFLALTAWLAAGNHLEVITDLSDALDKAFMLDARDFNHLGDLMMKSGKAAPAAHFYAKYREKMPTSFDPAIKAARAKLATGDAVGAAAAFREAGKYGQISRGDIVTLSNGLVVAKKFDEAHAFLDAEIEADKNFADAYFTKGIIYSMQGQCRKAIEYYGRTLFIDANNASAYTNMGYARLDCAETAEAIKAFQTALGISKNKIDHYDSNLGLAIAHLRNGNDPGADDSFKKALSLNPNLGKGLDALAKEGYVYTPAQAEDIRKLLAKFGK